jgi:hypothetical protein
VKWKTDFKSFFFLFAVSRLKISNFILIACNKDLFRRKIIIWEICCYIFRKTKNWKFKKFCSPTDEIYRETPGSGRVTNISQLFALHCTLDCFSKNIFFFFMHKKLRNMCSSPTFSSFFVNLIRRSTKLLEFSIFGFS